MQRLAGVNRNEDQLNLHIRFYVALILHDLINEVPMEVVSKKFSINRGFLQTIQQSTASYACKWWLDGSVDWIY